jgi:hypothetical protein
VVLQRFTVIRHISWEYSRNGIALIRSINQAILLFGIAKKVVAPFNRAHQLANKTQA